MKAEYYMRLALDQAQKAADLGEVPVGAVVVKDAAVVTFAHNLCECVKDATAHAEMLALKKSAEALGGWRLDDCTLYVTLEPCAMCAGAAVQSRVRRVVFGAFDPLRGCMGSVLDVTDLHGCATKAVGGVLQNECSALLSGFFEGRRG